MSAVAQSADRWAKMYEGRPLVHEPFHFANIANSPFTLQYLTSVLKLCSRGGRTLETGIGTGHGAIWLSLRGVCAEGIDYNPAIVERARQVNNLLGGVARFRTGDLFGLFTERKSGAGPFQPYGVIHHQGVLEHFTVPQIRVALAQQVACADWVVFSVPSVFYPFEPEFGDERLMPVDEWRRILEPFDVEELRYYGDPQNGEREHILCVLRGVRDAAPELTAMMTVAAEPFPEGISAIVHTRNEAQRIRDCLASLAGWTDQTIVCDMESSDDTLGIAREFTQDIIEHPLIPNFDRARNVSAMRARYRWIVYLDADERAPAGLGDRLRRLIAERGGDLEAVYLPFRHHFAGHWMHCLYPGYTAPRLLKNGKFYFNTRLHSGAVVDGRTVRFPADDPNLALVHYSFDSLSHYLDKLNRYTDGEALNMHRDGQPFSWQNAVRHFVADFRSYYDYGQAHQDEGHGFIYSFLSAFYRFEQHAKLFERRFHAGQLQPAEQQMPASVEQILEFALAEARRQPEPAPKEIAVSEAEDAASAVWSGPLDSPSGYGEESRHLLLGLAASGASVTGQVIPWGTEAASTDERDRERIGALCGGSARPGFVHFVHNFPYGFYRHPAAGASIGRTVFETDRLPKQWVDACNSMDYVWTASKFNRETFAASGVERDKLRVVPECVDPDRYRRRKGDSGLRSDLDLDGEYVFLSLFDWTLHKGWDVLLSAFLQEFCDAGAAADSPILLLKVSSTMGYDNAGIRQQAAVYCKDRLGIDLARFPQVRFLFDKLSADEMTALYKSANCYVMPSRGEGWGRPYMEAMAAGLPTIATSWSGNTEFMREETSFLLDYDLVPVPERAWREVGTYRGHRWAEPSVKHLRQTMRRVLEDRAEASAVGERAGEDIAARFNRNTVGRLVAEELTRVRETLEERSSGRPIRPPKRAAPPVRVRWEGAFFRWHSLAHVNRELCGGLIDSGRVDLALVPNEPTEFEAGVDRRLQLLAERQFAPLGAPADVHVRHFFPPRWEMPDEGHFVLMQPWEYGYIPTQWIDPIKLFVSEVWCNSNYVKQTYLAGGIPEAKLKLVPLGVDTGIFHPQAPPYVFTVEAGANRVSDDLDKRFVFLYVGGSIHRKGIDVLLDAYQLAFSRIDDVCLVVKDTGTKTVYSQDNSQARILETIGDETKAPIVYLDDDLSPHALAGIYAAADCIVAPYRGEGFCLPVLEAMACGLPAVVPAGGPTDDFVDETCGWRIPAERKPFGDGTIGQRDFSGPAWMFEVSPADLARLMRSVAQNREEAKRRGSAAAKRAAKSWTWRHSVDAVLKRLDALKKLPAPVRRLPPAAPVERGTESGAPPSTAVRRLPTISLCMIVRNEERVLGDCLASIKPWVDEIVVVDTGSTDATATIAEGYGARLFHMPWPESFSEARNESLKHATGDWILWMDADDTIPEECGRRLHDLVLTTADRVTGLLMQVRIPPAAGEHGYTIVDHVKLFRNGLNLKFEGRIHEQILEPIHRSGGSVERSDLYVVHSGYDYSPEGQKNKRIRDLALLDLDLADRPDHPFVLFNIGMTAFHMKDFDRAVPALERCLAVSGRHESTVRKVYAMLAGCALDTGDLDCAKRWIERGLSHFPRDPELLFRAGIIYREVGDLTGAERSYVKLLTERETGHIDSLDVTMTGYKAHHNLALVYMDTGRIADAEAHFHAAIQQHPGFAPSWLGLGELLVGTGRLDQAQTATEKLAEIDPEAAMRLTDRIRAARG